MKTIICERVVHDNENRVALRFPYDNELISSVKSIPGAKWSKRMHCLHIPYSDNVVKSLLTVFKGKAFVDYKAIYRANTSPKKEKNQKDNLDKRDSEEIRKHVEDLKQWMLHKLYLMYSTEKK